MLSIETNTLGHCIIKSSNGIIENSFNGSNFCQNHFRAVMWLNKRSLAYYESESVWQASLGFQVLSYDRERTLLSEPERLYVESLGEPVIQFFADEPNITWNQLKKLYK